MTPSRPVSRERLLADLLRVHPCDGGVAPLPQQLASASSSACRMAKRDAKGTFRRIHHRRSRMLGSGNGNLGMLKLEQQIKLESSS